MALDFPNAPIVGQDFYLPDGVGLEWDGTKWTSPGRAAFGDVGRNILHNPLFNVAQRGGGPWTASQYTVDRWLLGVNNDTASLARAPITDPERAVIGNEMATAALQTTFTGSAAAGSYTQVAQRIEGLVRLSGKTIVLSFWAKTAAGALQLYLNLDQNFGTGGAPSPATGTVPAGSPLTLNATWTRYSVTATMPSIAGKVFGTNADAYTGVDFIYSSTAAVVQSGTISLWGVQVEVGTVATPLEIPDLGYDLTNCSRFFQIGSLQLAGYHVATGLVSVSRAFSPAMRITPTIVPNFSVSANITAQAMTALDNTAMQAQAQVVATSGFEFVANFNASADL